MAKELKYGEVVTPQKPIPSDEPVFLLRGQDRYASAAVRFYATLRVASGDVVGAAACMLAADELDRWPIKKIPD